MSFATESKLYYHLIGIVSFNGKCEKTNTPDVFTRVTGKHVKYFLKILIDF